LKVVKMVGALAAWLVDLLAETMDVNMVVLLEEMKVEMMDVKMVEK